MRATILAITLTLFSGVVQADDLIDTVLYNMFMDEARVTAFNFCYVSEATTYLESTGEHYTYADVAAMVRLMEAIGQPDMGVDSFVLRFWKMADAADGLLGKTYWERQDIYLAYFRGCIQSAGF